jgi:hypothetical protein
MSVEKRSIALKQARPCGLREKSRHAVLEDLAREQPLPASSALPGEILRSNAARDEMATDPSHALMDKCNNRLAWPLKAAAASHTAGRVEPCGECHG